MDGFVQLIASEIERAMKEPAKAAGTLLYVELQMQY